MTNNLAIEIGELKMLANKNGMMTIINELQNAVCSRQINIQKTELDYWLKDIYRKYKL